MTRTTPRTPAPFDDHFRPEPGAIPARDAQAPGALEQMFGYYQP